MGIFFRFINKSTTKRLCYICYMIIFVIIMWFYLFNIVFINIGWTGGNKEVFQLRQLSIVERDQKDILDKNLVLIFDGLRTALEIDKGLPERVASLVNLRLVPDINPLTGEPYHPLDFYAVVDKPFPSHSPYKSGEADILLKQYGGDFLAVDDSSFKKKSKIDKCIEYLDEKTNLLPILLRMQASLWEEQIFYILKSPIFEQLLFRSGAKCILRGPSSRVRAHYRYREGELSSTHNCGAEVALRLWNKFLIFHELFYFIKYAIDKEGYSLDNMHDCRPGDILIYYQKCDRRRLYADDLNDPDTVNNPFMDEMPYHVGIITKINQEALPVEVWSKLGLHGVFVHSAHMGDIFDGPCKVLKKGRGTVNSDINLSKLVGPNAGVIHSEDREDLFNRRNERLEDCLSKRNSNDKITLLDIVDPEGEMLAGRNLRDLRIKRNRLYLLMRLLEDFYSEDEGRIVEVFYSNTFEINLEEFHSAEKDITRAVAEISDNRSRILREMQKIHNIDDIYDEIALVGEWLQRTMEIELLARVTDMKTFLSQYESSVPWASRIFTHPFRPDLPNLPSELEHIYSCREEFEYERKCFEFARAYNQILDMNKLILTSTGEFISSSAFDERFSFADRIYVLDNAIAKIGQFTLSLLERSDDSKEEFLNCM